MMTNKDLELKLLLRESHIQQLKLKVNNLEDIINKAIEYIENDLSHATSNGKLHRKHLLDILKELIKSEKDN